MLALWDGPRQRETYTWFTTEFANLRTAFRWSAANGDLDSAATLATHATALGVWLEQYEPVAWAEELIEPARAVNHRRLLQLYVLAAQCYAAGRTDDAFGYLEASQELTGSADFDPDLFESQTSGGVAYMAAGRPERWVDVCREAIARGPGPRTITRACLVMALNFFGDTDGVKMASEGLLAAADDHHAIPLRRASRFSRMELPTSSVIRSSFYDCLAPGPGDRPRQRKPTDGGGDRGHAVDGCVHSQMTPATRSTT